MWEKENFFFARSAEKWILESAKFWVFFFVTWGGGGSEACVTNFCHLSHFFLKASLNKPNKTL